MRVMFELRENVALREEIRRMEDDNSRSEDCVDVVKAFFVFLRSRVFMLFGWLFCCV